MIKKTGEPFHSCPDPRAAELIHYAIVTSKPRVARQYNISLLHHYIEMGYMVNPDAVYRAKETIRNLIAQSRGRSVNEQI